MMLDFSQPLVATYAVAASLMILKTVSMAWLTVFRMMQEKGGYRSPEDLRRTPLNPAPHPEQLAPNDRVERVRRIHLNDLENVSFFLVALVAGFLYILTGPPVMLAQILLYGYVLSRFLHFTAYLTAQTHDVRATLWTVGVLIIVYMSIMVLWAGLSA